MSKWNWRLFLGFFALFFVGLMVLSSSSHAGNITSVYRDDPITELLGEFLNTEVARLLSGVISASIAASGLNLVVLTWRGEK
jgi:hypothetical protein